ncbi:MAG: signal recognition particle-docking protein FtsY [Planctomycetes bacterium]|nr:signal recognition particle-docking protein FtsY [Planctomycetota bacterium]
MIFGRLRDGLRKTRDKFRAGLKSILAAGRKLDEDLLEELEEKLVTSDMGPTTALQLMDRLTAAYKTREIRTAEEVVPFLRRRLLELLATEAGTSGLRLAAAPPTVILVVGVNGTGKTTSIAKLAYHFHRQGKRVLLGAGDTFRAAAVEQLTIWAERIGCEIIKHRQGADPAAVAYDAVEAAVARRADVLIVDTAGRLHTQTNLMNELEKIRRVIGKKIPAAPHEVLLVLDATVGQNAIRQAQEFNQAVAVTGLILAKLDGTAKGGAVIGIRNEVPVPVKFVGLGEKLEDLEPFGAEAFVDAILE